MKSVASSPVLRQILLAICLLSGPAIAGTTHAVFNGKSFHFDSSYDWNEDNIGLGIEYEFTQRSAWKKIVMANGFRDSTDSMSYMAGAGLHRRVFETDKLDGFRVYAGINAFIMTRDDNGGDPFPGLLPSLSLGTNKIGINLTYLPRKAVEEITNSRVVDPTLSGILFLQFKLSLGNLTDQSR